MSKVKAGTVGLALAVAYALPTVCYPFSRDHGLFAYVGRVWLDGGLPYRDVYDFKPPGIFALNALAQLLFGYNEWGIRVLEIAGCLLASWIIVMAVRRDAPRAPSEHGAVALLFVGFYYTALNYWDTSQTEFWEALGLLGAYAVAENVRDVRRAALLSGALVGVAVLFKFPGALVGLACTGLLAWRGWRGGRWREATIATLLHGVGAAAVVAATGAYFAARGGWNDMIDMLFRHLWDFHSHTSAAPGEGKQSAETFWLHLFRASLPIALGGWGVAMAAAWRRRAWEVVRGGAIALLLAVLAVGTVAMQGRYVMYQWGVTIPFLALCAAYGVAEIGRRGRALPVVAAAAAVAFVCAFSDGLPEPYRVVAGRTIAYARGDIDRWTFLGQFGGPFHYSYRAEERIGDFLRGRARPGDQVVVRGYEPAVYVVSGLRSPSRFSVEIPLFLPGLTFKRAEWQAEHDAAIWNARPRFFVTFVDGVEEARMLEARGYRRVFDSENMVVFEREEPATAR